MRIKLYRLQDRLSLINWCGCSFWTKNQFMWLSLAWNFQVWRIKSVWDHTNRMRPESAKMKHTGESFFWNDFWWCLFLGFSWYSFILSFPLFQCFAAHPSFSLSWRRRSHPSTGVLSRSTRHGTCFTRSDRHHQECFSCFVGPILFEGYLRAHVWSQYRSKTSEK